MNKRFLSSISVLMLLLIAVSGCSTTTQARDWNGLSSPDGKAIGHFSTSNVALHGVLGVKPLWGNASLEKTVDDFTAAAKSAGASKVRIVQSSKVAWWFVFPPISFFLTPVTSNVAGEAIQ